MNAYFRHPVVQFLARAGGIWPRLLHPGDVFDVVAARTQYLRVGGLGYMPVFEPKGDCLAFMAFEMATLDAPIKEIAESLSKRHMVGVHSSYCAVKTGPLYLADAMPLLKLVATYCDILNTVSAGERHPITSLVSEHDEEEGWRDTQPKRSVLSHL